VKAGEEKNNLVTVLEIWEVKSGFVFRLQEPVEFMQPIRPVVIESTVKVSDGTIKNLCQRVERLAQTPGASVENYKACARALFDQLFSSLDAEIKNKFESIETPLLVSARETDIVWELLHDGEEFLSLKYPLSRQIRAGVRPPILPAKKFPNRCLVVANPTGEEELKPLEEQALQLIKHLRGLGIESRYLARSQATPEEVLIELSSGECDIFHFNGHAAKIDDSGNCVTGEEPGEYALQLAGGWLRSFEIEQAARGVGVAFLNGCQSARSVESLTSSFLKKGATTVIGTVFKVSSFGARVFAERFYDSALSGEQVGEAMLQARKFVRLDPRCGNAWACFAMYGDPCVRIVGITIPPELERNFSVSCRRVIEKCVRYSEPYGIICTPFLFAALLDGEDQALRLELRSRGVSADDLKEMFEAARKQEIIHPDGNVPLEVSRNVMHIISFAEAEAGKDGRKNITENDLISGFLGHGGGAIARLLARSGVNPAEINSKKADGDTYLFRDDGELDERKFDLVALKALEKARDFACKTGWRKISTPHLFMGLCCIRDGITSRLIRSQGFDPQLLSECIKSKCFLPAIETEQGRSLNIDKISRRFMHILTDAGKMAAAANKEFINEGHILLSFLQDGGGETAKLLQSMGIDLILMKEQFHQ
jgi:CHAT domain-containing protein